VKLKNTSFAQLSSLKAILPNVFLKTTLTLLVKQLYGTEARKIASEIYQTGTYSTGVALELSNIL
jgi:hypothetical protein